MNDINKIDIHVKAFLEETNELLADLEVSLVELEKSNNDPELLSKIFRDLHTIKGSAGMFGFDDITTFTHDIETVYDYIRNGSIQITKTIIDLTLAAKDQISLMIRSSEDNQLKDDLEIDKELLWPEWVTMVLRVCLNSANKGLIQLLRMKNPV